DIGIITPYAKQRAKLQQAIATRQWKGIVVGSVEQFQGGERRVILVSTVRSSSDFFDDDAKFNLGFVAHPKRFNVAITRAQALLIVVGNPDVLETSEIWRAFLEHCVLLGACAGRLPRAATAAVFANESMDDDEDDDDEYYKPMDVQAAVDLFMVNQRPDDDGS
ncbi:hypothetical protein As57867_017870, partial [Aphanomyces stellatus]